MILPLNAVWGGVLDPLAGNAQIYDGGFDYNTLSFNSTAQAQPFSFMFDYFFDVKKTDIGLWSDVQSGVGLELFIEGSGKVRFLIVNGSGNLYFINSTEVIGTGRNNIVFTWDGLEANIYLNGILLTRNTIANTLSGYSAATRTAS